MARLNLNDFIGAMQTMLPDYQLFLIDACRVPNAVTNAALRCKVHLGRACLDPDPNEFDNRGGKPARQSVHHAASAMSSAFGRITGLSLYTEALLRALRGGGTGQCAVAGGHVGAANRTL